MIFQVKADILLQMFIYMSKFFSKTIACLLCLVLSAGFVMPVFADEPSREDIIAERQSLPIESNDYENWPEGPAVAAESACLMDVETGTILYAKNMDKDDVFKLLNKNNIFISEVEKNNPFLLKK